MRLTVMDLIFGLLASVGGERIVYDLNPMHKFLKDLYLSNTLVEWVRPASFDVTDRCTELTDVLQMLKFSRILRPTGCWYWTVDLSRHHMEKLYEWVPTDLRVDLIRILARFRAEFIYYESGD
jgi:hypothetical protein